MTGAWRGGRRSSGKQGLGLKSRLQLACRSPPTAAQQAVVDSLAAQALEDPCAAANPRLPSAADAAQLLRAAWAAPAE
jgi:alcohol dehydrogenase class IV